MPAEDHDFSAAKWNPPERPTRTFYVDALAGDFAADETSVTGTVRIDYIWVGRVVADDDAKGICARRQPSV